MEMRLMEANLFLVVSFAIVVIFAVNILCVIKKVNKEWLIPFVLFWVIAFVYTGYLYRFINGTFKDIMQHLSF